MTQSRHLPHAQTRQQRAPETPGVGAPSAQGGASGVPGRIRAQGPGDAGPGALGLGAARPPAATPRPPHTARPGGAHHPARTPRTARPVPAPDRRPPARDATPREAPSAALTTAVAFRTAGTMAGSGADMLLPHIHRLHRPRVGSGRRSGRRAAAQGGASAEFYPPTGARSGACAPTPRRAAPSPAPLRRSPRASQCPAARRRVGRGRGRPELTSGPRAARAPCGRPAWGAGPRGHSRPHSLAKVGKDWTWGAASAVFLLGSAQVCSLGAPASPTLNCNWRGKHSVVTEFPQFADWWLWRSY